MDEQVEIQTVQQTDTSVNSGLENGMNVKVETQTVQQRDNLDDSSSENEVDEEVETQTVQQTDAPANSSSETVLTEIAQEALIPVNSGPGNEMNEEIGAETVQRADAAANSSSGPAKAQPFQEMDRPADSSSGSGIGIEVETYIAQQTDTHVDSSSGNSVEKVVETQTVKQIDTPANSSSGIAKSLKKNPSRKTRQTRSMTRQIQTSSVDTTEKVRVAASDNEDDIVASDDVIEEELSETETTERQGKGIKRKKNESCLPHTNNSSTFKASWNERDKRRLLIALQRYGILEIEKLVNAVPGKSEEEIRKFITVRWKMARTELRAHLRETRKSKGDNRSYLGPVDKWLEVLAQFYPNYDHYKTNPIAHAVLLIWKYEEHPDPAKCGGVDFKALYEYMYFMLCGYPPKHLNQPTAAFLAETLKNFSGHIRNGDWSELKKHLEKPIKMKPSKRSPASKDDVIAALSYSKERCIEELAKLSGFNPFSIPSNLLKMQDAPDPVNSGKPS